MTIMIASNGKLNLLKFALGILTPGNQSIGLFVNNYAPGEGTLIGNLTEMSTQGYAAKTLTKTSWVGTQGADGSPASAAYATQTWTFDGTGGLTTVYGYFVKDVTTGLLLWAEAFASSKNVQNSGDQIIITPTITNTHA